MSEPFSILNAMREEAARDALGRCCGARRWVDGMLSLRPYASNDDLFDAADEVWSDMGKADILEAFSHHPRIGENLDALREKFARTASWSEGEQTGVTDADEATLRALRDDNQRYVERFGHIFIVCATGKSAHEMLDILRSRIDNPAQVELMLAAAEQAKITRLRLEKLSP